MGQRRIFRKSQRAAAAVAAAVALAVALSSCAASSDASTSTSKATGLTKDSKLAALLPASVRSAGILKVAVPDGSAPLSSVDDSGKAVGQDPDLAKALGQLFGVKVQLNAGSYDAQITGLQAGRNNIAMGGYYVTPARLANADFVTYWSDTSSFATRKDDKWKPATASALCGHPVAVLKGSAEEASTTAYNNASCSKKMKISSFADQPSALLALSSGRVDAMVTGRSILVAATTKTSSFKISGKFGGGPVAVAVARNGDSAALEAALKAGFDELIKDGTYAKILKKWATSYGAEKEAVVYTKDSTPPVYS